jgi:tetratricopeptide (TPR) repeat protein
MILVLVTVLAGCRTSKGKGQATVPGLLALDEAIEEAVAEIEAKVVAGLEITVAEITAPREEIGNFLVEELIGKFGEREKVVVLARNAGLRFADAEQQFQMSGLVLDAAVVGIGHYLGAKVVVSGTFERFDDFSQIRLRAVNVETSAVVALYSARIRNSDPILANLTAPLRNIQAMPITEQALAHLNNGKDLLAESKYDEAIVEFGRTLEINSGLADAYNYRGIAYSDKGDYDEAMADYAQVTRIDPGYNINLSGYWNFSDVKFVCESLINECLNSPGVVQAIAARRGRKPIVIVGMIRNESNMHIDTSIISSFMEKAIIDSDKLDSVERQETIDIRGTAAALSDEIGADFMLSGSVNFTIERVGNTSVRLYSVRAELINIETNARLWVGVNNKIKKVIGM